MLLKEIRKSRGYLKQMDFARAMGVKQSTLSMWENGKTKPDVATIKKLAEVLQVDVKEILECF